MLKLRLNRKGISEDWTELFVSLVIMLVIILLFVVKAKESDEEKFFNEKNNIDDYNNLITYLRSYYIDNGKEVNIAESIVSSKYIFSEQGFDEFTYNMEGGDDFGKFTKDFFDKIYRFWGLSIWLDEKLIGEYGITSTILSGWRGSGAPKIEEVDKLKIKLPTSKGDLEVLLKIYKTK